MAVRVLRGEVRVLRGEVRVLRDEVRVLRDEVRVLRDEVRVLRGELLACLTRQEMYVTTEALRKEIQLTKFMKL